MMKQNLKICLNPILCCLLVGWMLMSLALPAWAQEPEDKPLTEADLKKMLFEDKQSQYHYLFLEAVSQLNAGRLELADSLLHQCLTLHPQGAETYYVQGRLLAQQKKDTLALKKFEKAAALQPENSHYQERVAQYYIGTGAFDKAIAAYERLYENDHQRTDVLSILGQLYNQQKNYDKMLSVLERIEQAEGNNEELTLSKMSVYEMMGDKDAARKTLQQLADSHPNDVNYRVMLGNWLMQHGGQKKAYKLFTQALEEEPENGFVLASLYDYHNQVGDKEKAVALRDRILMSKDTEVQTKMTMLQQVIRDNEDHKRDSTEVLNLFKRMMKVHPKDADIASLAAAYMSLKKMPQDTVMAALQHVIDIAPDNSPARLQLLRMYLPGKNWKKIIALCEEGAQFTPDEMAYYYYMAWAHVQQDEQPKAIDALKRGVSTINDKSDTELVSEFYSMMGDLLHQQGDQQGAFAAYDSCLQWKDDNIACLNNYAYFLSEDGQNLKRAEQMSYKTVTASPNNATYLDTYAWILFMQERYTEAKLYIDQALKNDTDSVQSAVIIEHAGDIYAMNGNIDQALKYWQEALKLASKDDQALIERKIKQKKYIKK